MKNQQDSLAPAEKRRMETPGSDLIADVKVGKENRGSNQTVAVAPGILVLGMHRSGTSAVAGLLERAGAYLGEDSELLPAHAIDNPSGYWERSDLMVAHDCALAESDYAWDRVAGFDARQIDAAVTATLSKRIAQTIACLRDGQTPWLVKDPRLCLLLPCWLEQVPNAACVVVVRDPRRIAASLIETDRGVYTSHFLLALWEKYLRSVLANLRGKRALFVSYEQLLRESQSQCARLVDGLRTLGIVDLHAADEKIGTFLRQDLRRSQPGPHVRLSEQQASLFAWLQTQSERPGPVDVGDFPQAEMPDATLLEFQRAQDDTAKRAREELQGETHVLMQALTQRIDEATHQRNLTSIELGELRQKILGTEERLHAVGADLAAARQQQTITAAELDATRQQQTITAAELDATRQQQTITAAELDATRHQRNLTAMELALYRRHAEELGAVAETLRASWSWKITAPLRGTARLFRVRPSGAAEQRLYRWYYAIPGISAARKRNFVLWLHEHAQWLTRNTLSYRLARKAEQNAQQPMNAAISAAQRMDAERAAKHIAGMTSQPLISIVMPVYNVERRWLLAAVDSVRRQFYPHWELCVVDDASTREETRAALREIDRFGESRIRQVRLKKNVGIALASNAALKLARGEYVGLLDHDDELTRDALLETALAINAEHPDVIYSDEDKLELDGRHCEPHFKPDFSLEYFLSINYLCHFSVVRRKLLEVIGGFRAGFDGAQDFDLLLRTTERGGKVTHIPKILYHWRKIEASTASNSAAKPAASDAGLRAVGESVRRRGIDANVIPGPYPTTYRIQRAIAGDPLVSIILPFRDKPELLKMCVGSILAKTDHAHFEIVGIDNGSTDPATLTLMDKLSATDARVRFIRHDVPFNYSRINNFGVRQARGEHLLFLNNDTEVIEGGWLRAMLEHSQRRDVGVVGAKLLYPDNRIQHAGVIVGIGGVAGHAHLFEPAGHPGYFARAQLPQELSAVTFACAMTRRAVFEQVGGLNEKDLTIAFNDVDYCLRVRETGLLVVYTPYASLYHHESLTRGYEDNPEKQTRFAGEIAYMQRRHAKFLEHGDPYYNPNLRLDTHDFSPRPGYVDALPR